jgi:RNA polymerase sigma factor (sigma-70 family)
MNPDQQKAVFDEWLADHAGILRHVAHAFATGADRHDLMQELMLAVWRAVPSYRAASRASTFIFRVTHNAALNWKRAERGYRRRLDDFERLRVDAPESRAADANPTHDLERLYAAIHRLEPLDRSLVVLHLDGASYAQIAEIHGLTETNVGVRLNRLKHKLTSILQETP